MEVLVSEPSTKSRVYQVIDYYVAANGYSPTVREIAKEVGISVSTAQVHVQDLIRAGLLTSSTTPGTPRTLRPVK